MKKGAPGNNIKSAPASRQKQITVTSSEGAEANFLLNLAGTTGMGRRLAR